MPHDPARIADTRAWLTKALLDLRAAEHDLSASPALFEDVMFHCQQAIEKAFKAFLSWHDRPFRKTHNLEEIGELCIGLDPSFEALVDCAVPFTEYAWKFRYPGEPEELSEHEAEEALDLANEIFEHVLSRLPEEVRK